MKYANNVANDMARIATPISATSSRPVRAAEKKRAKSNKLKAQAYKVTDQQLYRNAFDSDRARHMGKALQIHIDHKLDDNASNGLCHLFHHVQSQTRTHCLNRRWSSISRDEFYEWFGKNHELVKAVKAGVLRIEQDGKYNKDQGVTKAYTIKPEALASWKNADNEFEKRPSGDKPLPARHLKARHKCKTLKMPTEVTILTEQMKEKADILRQWAEYLKDPSTSEEPNSLHQEVCELSLTIQGDISEGFNICADQLDDIRTKADKDSRLEQLYTQKEAGRWVANGPSIQSARSIVRRISLGQCWSYDISTAVHKTLQKVAIDNSLKHEMLDELINDKDSVRWRYANRWGLGSIKVPKQVMTAIGYGARIAEGSDLHADIGNRKLWNKIAADKELHALAKEVTEIFGWLYRNGDRSTKHKVYRNKAGMQKPMKSLMPGSEYRKKKGIRSKEYETRAEVVAFYVQGFESAALSAMIDVATDPLVPIHDCLICRSKQNKAVLERAIFEATGVEYKLNEEQL